MCTRCSWNEEILAPLVASFETGDEVIVREILHELLANPQLDIASGLLLAVLVIALAILVLSEPAPWGFWWLWPWPWTRLQRIAFAIMAAIWLFLMLAF